MLLELHVVMYNTFKESRTYYNELVAYWVHVDNRFISYDLLF
jgi:hypothetical protein